MLELRVRIARRILKLTTPKRQRRAPVTDNGEAWERANRRKLGA